VLWPDGRPGQPLSQPSVRLPFKRAVEHAELPDSMRLHDLRHSFASLFLIDGGDVFKLSKILGHSSVTITEKTYAHLEPDAYEGDDERVVFRVPATRVFALVDAGDKRDTGPCGSCFTNDDEKVRTRYAMFLFAKSQFTTFQNASMNLGRALR
jgi:hypothetical protein